MNDRTQINANEQIIEKFYSLYGKMPKDIAFAPYRVCPLGAHCDHQLGIVTGFALDKGIYAAYLPEENGEVKVSSLQFSLPAAWNVNSIPSMKFGDWADHLRGASKSLCSRYPLHKGISVVIDGELPIGGLSSSAAVIIAFLCALCRVNEITVTRRELIEIAKEAENKYVGVSCGKLDQSCEVYCKADNLLYMDMLDDSYEQIPAEKSMKPYEIAIFFSGIDRSLAGTKYNMRVDEARAAAYSLKAFAGIEYGKFEEANLRDLPYEIYRQYKDKLPEKWAKRAEHFYSEFQRVKEGAQAWKTGDIEKFGRLCFESGQSSVVNWETGSPELTKLFEILTHTEGIYGGRFSGAGIKGCCMAIIDPAYEQAVTENVGREYKAAFPNLSEKYGAYICHSADGVKL